MTEHSIGTREEWQAARDELAKLEAEHAELTRQVTEKRRELPWVPVEKEYEFDTEDGKKTLFELFEGRSQLLAYNIMYGPDYELGACPGCTSVGDELDGPRTHLDHQDVTLICFSRAPIDRLIAYKERMGWKFPYVSTYGSEFPFDFGLALTPEQAQEIPQVQEMLASPPPFLQEWSRQVGAKLEDGLREAPSWIAIRAHGPNRLPHLHRDGARPVRRAVPLVPTPPHAEDPVGRLQRPPQGRVPRTRGVTAIALRRAGLRHRAGRRRAAWVLTANRMAGRVPRRLADSAALEPGRARRTPCSRCEALVPSTP